MLSSTNITLTMLFGLFCAFIAVMLSSLLQDVQVTHTENNCDLPNRAPNLRPHPLTSDTAASTAQISRWLSRGEFHSRFTRPNTGWAVSMRLYAELVTALRVVDPSPELSPALPLSSSKMLHGSELVQYVIHTSSRSYP